MLVDEATIFAFYDGIIPDGIANGAAFEKWRKQAERETPALLYLSREYLMRHSASGITEEQFPDSVTVDGARLPLTYRFDPGHILDGVTITVPLPLLNKLDAAQFDWLVPGLIREKVTWYLKALPKQIRRHVVPVPEFVTQFLEDQEPEPTTDQSQAFSVFFAAACQGAGRVCLFQGRASPFRRISGKTRSRLNIY